jgi:hypothetical protein
VIHEGAGGGEIAEIQMVAGVLSASERKHRLPFQLRGGGEVGPGGRHLAQGVEGIGPVGQRDSPSRDILSSLGFLARLVREPLGFDKTAHGEGHPCAVPKTNRGRGGLGEF